MEFQASFALVGWFQESLEVLIGLLLVLVSPCFLFSICIDGVGCGFNPGLVAGLPNIKLIAFVVNGSRASCIIFVSFTKGFNLDIISLILSFEIFFPENVKSAISLLILSSSWVICISGSKSPS